MRKKIDQSEYKSVYKEDWCKSVFEYANHQKGSEMTPPAVSVRLRCPICGENLTENLIELREDFWQCRKCGYSDVVAMWDGKNDLRIPLNKEK